MHKKNILGILLVFAYLLLCPQAAISSAREGLLLWYHFVLPVLFPFLFLGNLAIHFVKGEDLPSCLTKPLMRLFNCSPSGAFVILAGFLCGLPMGAKLAGDLYRENKISREETIFLSGFSNNLSPGFICSYLAVGQMKMPKMTGWFLVQILGSALLFGLFEAQSRRKKHFKKHNLASQKTTFQKAISREAPSFQQESEGKASDSDLFAIVDSCIYNAIENVLRLGGYILLFCILSGAITRFLPLSNPTVLLAVSWLEVTNGIRILAESSLPLAAKYVAVSALASSGGFCALAQSIGTGHMDREMICHYIKSRAKITLLSITIAIPVILA